MIIAKYFLLFNATVVFNFEDMFKYRYMKYNLYGKPFNSFHVLSYLNGQGPSIQSNQVIFFNPALYDCILKQIKISLNLEQRWIYFIFP